MSDSSKLKAKISEVDTSSSYSICYLSEPFIPKPVPNAAQGQLKLKLKYQEEFSRYQAEKDLKTQERLMKLDFIIRNTKQLNSILSPDEQEYMVDETPHFCYTHRWGPFPALITLAFSHFNLFQTIIFCIFHTLEYSLERTSFIWTRR